MSQSPMTMESAPRWDNEFPQQELVKCVVVGDTGVGKTRLICARACGTKYSLEQLTQTHVPTVWAIDHYRHNRMVLERSWFSVDNVRVSLRLWDTFGYHDKDRRFAYGRADVVLICFSAVKPQSLKSVITHWLPEVRCFCPHVPVILIACKTDLRYLYLDEGFLCLDKGPFYKEIKESDLITPEAGRAVAKKLGILYYETSVLTQFGVHEVFENVVRTALSGRRRTRFWTPHLKKITKPTCQAPFLPLKPPCPVLQIPAPQITQDLLRLLHNQQYCDVIFLVRGVGIQAHQACLAAAAPVFQELFTTDLSLNGDGKKFLRKNSRHKNGGTHHELNSDKDNLLDNEELDSEVGRSSDEENGNVQHVLPTKSLNHPAFVSIHLDLCDNIYSPGSKILQTIVTLNDEINPIAFQLVLEFLYTGTMVQNTPGPLVEVKHTASLLDIPHLEAMLTNRINNEEFLNQDLEVRFLMQRAARVRQLLLKKGLFSDVQFQVDDGSVSAHKPLLMARCDMMFAMFSDNFRESSAKEVPFPGVVKETFIALQEYLYTGVCPSLHQTDPMELIELGNRLCLPRLVALTEQYLVKELSLAAEEGEDIAEDVLYLLQPAQFHNADQLAAWCHYYLATNYSAIYKNHYKLLQSLRPDIQASLSRRRWPPLWYLKEYDYYEKCLVELEREKPTIKVFKRHRSSNSGCLCFCGKGRRKQRLEKLAAENDMASVESIGP